MMVEDRSIELSEVFVSLADSLRADHDVVDTLDLLIQASTTFTSAAEAGIVLADGAGRLHVMASSSERASAVEEAQLGAKEGPCFEAFTTGSVVEIPHITATRDRWPEFVAATQQRGLFAAHAVPLQVRGQVLGAMNLFSAAPGALSDRESIIIEAMANVATISVVQTQTRNRDAALAEQLQHALNSRVVIEQAKGVLAHRHNIAMDAAFAILRNHARRHGNKLADTARQVISAHLPL
jgi:transcriptional regulator with GAF, ATPase, and Fis domain